MTKPPAFQFYPADFLVGTADMSCEEVGAYIRLLCYQWTKGGIPSDPAKVSQLSGLAHSAGNAPAIARALLGHKFTLGADGLYRNERLERVRQEQDQYREKMSEKGKNGAKSRWNHGTGNGAGNARAIAVPMPKQWQDDSSSPSPSPSPSLAGEREPDFPEVGRPDEEEVKMHASRIGLADWKALDWLDEMRGCGWLDFQGRAIADWKSVLNRVRTKWEADGRPMGPPVAKRVDQPDKPKSLGEKEAERLLKQARAL